MDVNEELMFFWGVGLVGGGGQGGCERNVGVGGDVGYWGCEPRIEGIVACRGSQRG